MPTILSGIITLAGVSFAGGDVRGESEGRPLNLPGKIVFQTDREIRPYEGAFLLEKGEMRRIADGVFPRFSKDGKKALYQREGILYLLDLATQQIQVLNWTKEYYPGDFDLSPDQQWLAFTSGRVRPSHWVNPPTSLFVARIDGSEVRQLFDANETVYACRWAPDGTRILFDTWLFPTGNRQKLPGGPFTIFPDGTHLEKLPVPDELKLGGGAWAPDGKRVLFVGIDSQGVVQLFFLDLETRSVSQITRNPNPEWRYMSPVFSPDGSQILFVSDRKGDPVIGCNLYVINADGTNERQVTPAQKIKKYGRWRWATDRNPDWAP